MTQPKRKTAFELYAEAQAIMSTVHEEDDQQAWVDQAVAWIDEAEDKLLAIRVVRTGLLARVQDAKSEADRFTAMAKRHKSAAERVDEYARMLILAREMMTDERGAKVPTSDGGWCKLANYPKVDDSEVDLDVLAASHPDLVSVVVTKKVDKAEVKRRLKKGDTIPGLRLLDNRKVAWSK